MKITIHDWSCSGLLQKSEYSGPPVTEGNIDDVFSLARKFFDEGFNVMLIKYPRRNIGTRKNPNWFEEEMVLGIDNKRFQSR